MADFTALTAVVDELKTVVADATANMDKNFAALVAALAVNDQPAVDAAAASVQASVDSLKAAIVKDTVV